MRDTRCEEREQSFEISDLDGEILAEVSVVYDLYTDYCPATFEHADETEYEIAIKSVSAETESEELNMDSMKSMLFDLITAHVEKHDGDNLFPSLVLDKSDAALFFN